MPKTSALETLSGGQFTLSTLLLKLNYLVKPLLTKHHHFLEKLTPVKEESNQLEKPLATVLNNTYFFSTLFLSKMDYRECNFGPSCTCDHRPTLVHGTSPNFSTPNVRGSEPLSLTSPSCTKKEHIDNNLRKKSRGEGL